MATHLDSLTMAFGCNFIQGSVQGDGFWQRITNDTLVIVFNLYFVVHKDNAYDFFNIMISRWHTRITFKMQVVVVGGRYLVAIDLSRVQLILFNVIN